MSKQVAELFTSIVKAPFGAIGIRVEHGQLCELSYLPPQYEAKPGQDSLSKNIAKQVHATESKDDAIYIIQHTAVEYEMLNRVLAKLGE